MHYLGNIKKGLLALVGGDKQALKRFDRPAVAALELRAPGASTADAQFLRNQGRAIFSAFSNHERDQILDRLPMVDGLILTLSSLFRDLNYLQLLVDCLKRLVVVPKRGSVCETIQSKYTGVNQREGQVKIQVTEGVTEDAFIYQPGTDADRVELGWRQLVAFAMRYYPYMPRDPIREDAVRKATTKADQAVLRQFADLAYELGFETPQIHTLRQHSSSQIAGDDDPQFLPLHVTSGPGVEMRQRSGIPHIKAYKEDRYSLFISHLHDTQAYQDEGITSFFVRKSVYLAFFGKPDEASIIHSLTTPPFSSGSAFDSTRVYPNRPPRHNTSQSQGRRQYVNDDTDDIVSSSNRRENTSELRGASENSEAGDRHLSNQERLEQERRDQDRQEQDRRNEERREEERREEERREEERREEERREEERREQLEQERLEEERQELRRIEETLEREDLQERLAQASQAQGNLEQEKQRQQEQEKREQERQEEEMRRQETREQGRREQEKTVNDSERARKRHTQIDMESVVSGGAGNQRSLSTAGPAQELQQARTGDQHMGQETAEPNLRLENDQASGRQERLEWERLERERQKQRRLQQERLEQERLQQERLEQERLEQERLEQERLEQERLEQERLEQERLEQERLEQERLEQERLEQGKRDQEKREQERLKREKFQERFAQKLQEQEKLEQEKQEREKREKDRQEQEKRELDRREEERQRQERREQRRWEQEKTVDSEGNLEPAQKRHNTPAEAARPTPRRRQVRCHSLLFISARSLLQDATPLAQENLGFIRITFKVWERGVWRTAQSLLIDSSDPSKVERIAVKYMRKKEQIRLYDTDLNILTPQMCFQAAVANRSNMLLLIPEREIDINEELEASVSQLLSELDSQREAGIE